MCSRNIYVCMYTCIYIICVHIQTTHKLCMCIYTQYYTHTHGTRNTQTHPHTTNMPTYSHTVNYFTRLPGKLNVLQLFSSRCWQCYCPPSPVSAPSLSSPSVSCCQWEHSMSPTCLRSSSCVTITASHNSQTLTRVKLQSVSPSLATLRTTGPKVLMKVSGSVSVLLGVLSSWVQVKL